MSEKPNKPSTKHTEPINSFYSKPSDYAKLGVIFYSYSLREIRDLYGVNKATLHQSINGLIFLDH